MGHELDLCDNCRRPVARGRLRLWIHSEDAPIRFTFHTTVHAFEMRLCAECHAAAAAEETAWHAPTRRTTAVVGMLAALTCLVSLGVPQFWSGVFRVLFGPSTQELAAEHALMAAPIPWPTRDPLDGRRQNDTEPR